MSNYPDDVSAASFDRYWNDKLGPDTDEDPTPDDYGCAVECDGCGLSCETIHGDENHSICCVCITKDAPASYRKDLCGACAERTE